MSEPANFDLVAAALRRDSGDIATYARVLTDTLGDLLPADCVTVERDRSLADRMRGRPGEVTSVLVRLGDKAMTLAVEHGRTRAELVHEVRGVVLSRDQVTFDIWLDTLAQELLAYAEANGRAAQALDNFLHRD